MRDRGDEIHLEFGEPLRARARKNQNRHADHQQEEHSKTDRQIAAAGIRNERPERSSAAMPHDQAPILIRSRVTQEWKPRDRDRCRWAIFFGRRMENMNRRILFPIANAHKDIHGSVRVGDFRFPKARVR